MKISISFLTVAALCQVLISCGQEKPVPSTDSVAETHEVAPPSVAASQNVEAKTFEVIDSLGKSHGWGYDLYVDGKRTIHQPIIPAVAGNNSFASQADAQKVGDLAASKMKKSGSLPTILEHDLDSLGIDHLK